MLKKLLFLGIVLSLTSCTKAPETIFIPELPPNVQAQRFYDESGQFSFLIPHEFHNYIQTNDFSDKQGVALSKSSDTALCVRTSNLNRELLDYLKSNANLTRTILLRGLAKDLEDKKETEKLLKEDQIVKVEGVGKVAFSYREINEPGLPNLLKGVFITIHRDKLIELVVYCPASQISSDNPEDFLKGILTYTLKSFKVESNRP